LAGVSRGRSQQLTPCELPAGPAAFFGREQVMAAISRELTRRARAGRPRLAVVSGPPGIGKTATVVQIADRLRQDFPDGQIYTDLDQPNEPAMPASALLGRLLRSLGLTGLPDGVDERSALLRSVLAARRVLVVLDNVHSESQVRPLLGTSSGSALLVAGCERLPALSFGTTAELAALDETAAKSLLGGLIGNARITAESAAGKAIIDYCERNPLALSIAGMVLAARPRRGLADFARLMADKDNRLDRLVAGDLSVRASVEARCRRLAADEMHALRQIGSHTLGWFEPGDIGNIPAGIVDRLIRGHFLEESAAARCRVEPLVRLYLAELDTRSRSVHAISLMNTVTAHSA
jgi:hypothetical protein